MPIVVTLIAAAVLVAAVTAFVIARQRAEHRWRFSGTRRDTEPKPWILRIGMPRSRAVSKRSWSNRKRGR